MYKYLLVLLFIAFHLRLSAQQFSQYNTGTLYDSFENPTQKAFIPDSSRKVAFNLFVPNFNLNFSLTGNAQSDLKSRVFANVYDLKSPTTIGKKNFNYANLNLNAYFIMLKFYTSLDGDQELGISGQTKMEGRGVFTDESVQLFADNSKFTNAYYSNLFNSRYDYQVYHNIGLTYRQNMDDQLAFGIKLSALLGVVENKVNINSSNLNIDRANDQAFLSLTGNYRSSYQPGAFTGHDILPTFRNPGAAISLGVSYITDNNFKLQFNLKDLGFIHWNSQSLNGDFSNTGIVKGLSQPGFEDSLKKTATSIFQYGRLMGGYTTPTDSHFEFTASHSYMLSESGIKYSPTLVLSKQLFYTGFIGALVNHFQYQNFVATLTASDDDMHLLSIGAQLMFKTPNAEVFIGSDRLQQNTDMIVSAFNSSSSATRANGPYSGASFYLGFSFKFGPVIEHQSNSSVTPMGDRPNFFKRFWQQLTKKVD
jgi:hypothetical protein